MLLTHDYGPNVTILDDPFTATLLTRIGAPTTGTERLPSLVRLAYERLVQCVLAREFPTRRERSPTRMTATEPRAFVDADVLCAQTPLVLCAVIRAGILPAQSCYEIATGLLPPANVRLDFLNLSRVTDPSGHVVGVRLDGSKIGGPVDDAVLLIPDPMGATGGTIVRVVETYRTQTGTTPRACIAMHLMVTPEAIARIRADAPETKIYACRLDRGLSPRDVLDTRPGTAIDRERGLNDQQYIVPGAGGMGELLTNSWV